MNLFEKDKTYIASTYNRFPVAITSGKGVLLSAEDGREYIDLTYLDQSRVELHYDMPLNEIIFDFFDHTVVKSGTFDRTSTVCHQDARPISL